MNFMNAFAKRLKELRMENHITTRQLGKAVGVSNASIVRWENCTRIPSIENVIAIALYFKVSLDYLCGLED